MWGVKKGPASLPCPKAGEKGERRGVAEGHGKSRLSMEEEKGLAPVLRSGKKKYLSGRRREKNWNRTCNRPAYLLQNGKKAKKKAIYAKEESMSVYLQGRGKYYHELRGLSLGQEETLRQEGTADRWRNMLWLKPRRGEKTCSPACRSVDLKKRGGRGRNSSIEPERIRVSLGRRRRRLVLHFSAAFHTIKKNKKEGVLPQKRQRLMRDGLEKGGGAEALLKEAHILTCFCGEDFRKGGGTYSGRRGSAPKTPGGGGALPPEKKHV